MNYKKLLLLLIVVCCTFCMTYLHAQTDLDAIIYQCDFEDFESHDGWVLNAGNQGEICVNKWSIGAAGSNGGSSGLFVSNDKTTNNYSDETPLSVVVWREVTLDSGEYEFSFDWQAAGWQDSISNIDGMYVCWVPATEATNSRNNNEVMPSFVEKYALDFWCGDDLLTKLSQKSWNTVVDTIKSDGTPHKIVFVWRNGVNGVRPPAACVDNILIMPVGYCYKPSDLKVNVEDYNVVFSWSGQAEAYDVRCYNDRTKKWKTYDNVRDTSLIIEGMDEGMCTYYVRSRCEGINGTWVSISQFVYYAGMRCIDYMGLSSNNCFTGMNPAVDPNSVFVAGCVDKGYMSIDSRHTLHYDLDERDANTGGGLRTVPEGEVASVRLGNWNTGGEAERVEYRYKVDAKSSAVLILKYAVVLQDPKHKEVWQPKFELEILKSDGSMIDPKGCGEAKFTAGSNTSDWNDMGNGVVLWKDWTTVSINLRDHDGEDIIVRLTTYDCAELGHYCYAYFTLNCASGELESSACGEVEYDTLRGPEGFNYRWYKKSDKNNTLSEEREYVISTSDTEVYCLDVIQPTQAECYYTLETQGMQRKPVADYAYEAIIENCENKVKFTDKSYIAMKNAEGKYENSGLPCDVLWDFGDGSTSSNANPSHYYSAVGGQYTVKLTASMNGKCDSIIEFQITLPNVTDMRDTIVATICPGGFYELKLAEDSVKRYFATGLYADTVPTEYGCDNITVLDLTVLEAVEEYDTICSTDVYEVDGVQVTESGRYVIKSSLGCDSIVKNVLVNESLLLDIDSIVSVCATDDNLIIPYVEKSGRLLEYSLKFKDEVMLEASVEGMTPIEGAMVVPMSKGVVPNRYKATLSFGELACGGEDIDILVDVYYPDSVIAQRWNDVLAVKDSMFNGGYKFTEYQWYKNNEPIEGATSSILYVDGNLDFDAEYSVMLTRKDGEEEIKEMVCAVKPIELLKDNEDNAVVVFQMNAFEVKVQTSESARVKIWSTVGVLVGEYLVPNGEVVLNTDNISGLYIFEFIFEDGKHVVERVIL